MGSGSDFLHQAFLYESADNFVETMAPFMREGLERGDTVFVETKGSNVAALAEELGDDRERVELHDNRPGPAPMRSCGSGRATSRSSTWRWPDRRCG